jgi:hypothetical protein
MEPFGLAVDSQFAYWSDQNGGTVNKVALAGGTPMSIAIHQGRPIAVALADTAVVWANQDDGTVVMMPK